MSRGISRTRGDPGRSAGCHETGTERYGHLHGGAGAGRALHRQSAAEGLDPVGEADQAVPRVRSAPPRPSSRTRTRNIAASTTTWTSTTPAPACLTAFVNASATT